MGFPEAKWAVDQVVSKIGVQPNNMRKFEAVPVNETTIGLKFLEPEDSYYSPGGAIAAVTKGVIIRMSADGYPQNINDGTFVIDNSVLGKYENEYFEVTGLTKGTKYYFTAFPYSNIGAYNESLNAANKADAIPSALEKVSVTINIDDPKRFTSTTVTLKNVNTSEQTTIDVAEAKTVMLEAKTNNTYIVTVAAVAGYKSRILSTEQFTAVAGGSRAFTFNFEIGFLYGIKFDNGGDGIPSSYEYLEDCAGFTAASVSEMNSWAGVKILDKFKPCLIKPGATAPEYYLNKDNYAKRAEGDTASILTGADGDVMIEVERMWFKIVKNTDSTATLYISEVELDGYKSFIGDQEVAYRGAYEASVSGGVMRSISGVAPAVSSTRATFRGYAKARGGEYSQNDYYLLRLWQCMYILLYGTRDSQTAIGKGYSVSGNTGALKTGKTNMRPFCWGETDGFSGMKFLGVENFYGNVWEFVDGLTIVDYVCKITEDPSKYDDVGTSYEITAGAVPSASDGGYIKKMQATNDAPFLPSDIGGSETTYFCDILWTNSGTMVACFGGGWNIAGQAGAFCWFLGSGASDTDSSTGSRLCRKKVSSQNV